MSLRRDIPSVAKQELRCELSPTWFAINGASLVHFVLIPCPS